MSGVLLILCVYNEMGGKVEEHKAENFKPLTHSLLNSVSNSYIQYNASLNTDYRTRGFFHHRKTCLILLQLIIMHLL